MAIKCVKYLCNLSDGRTRVVFTDGTTTNYARLIGAVSVGRPLLRTEVAHHRNGDCSDDRLANIEVLSASDHARWHSTKPRPPRVIAKKATAVPVSVRFDDELWAKIKASAEENCRSLNGEIVHALRKSLEGWRQ